MIVRSAVIAIFILAAVPPAGAQPARNRADDLYDQGRGLIAADKILEACAAFEESQQLEPAITTLIALATCRERLGKLATAMELFLEADRQTRSASDPKAAQLQKIAQARAASLESRVSRLTISVSTQSKIDQLEIFRDRERLPTEAWNRALPVDGGTYTITARAPGTREWSVQVRLAVAADSKTIDIPDLRTFEAGVPRPSVRPGTKLAQSPEVSSTIREHGSVLPIAVGAGSVALLGGALAFSLWGDSTYHDAQSELTDQSRRDTLEASANRKRLAAQGLVAGGVGCAGVAVWLYLRQRGAPAMTASAHSAS